MSLQLPTVRRCLLTCALLLWAPLAQADPYVTAPSGVRWNEVGGLSWSDPSGVRWNEVGGVRWNEVGGVRWNEVGGVLFNDASGVRWNEVGGVRWNEVGALVFDEFYPGPSIDIELLSVLSDLPDTSSLFVIVTYDGTPQQADLDALTALGILGGTVFRQLPMVVVDATPAQIEAIAQLPGVRSIWADRTLSFFDELSSELIGIGDLADDPEIDAATGAPLTGAGVTIAVLDTGLDTTHPDFAAPGKVVENVELLGATSTGPGFTAPLFIEGVVDSDPVLGHGTFAASVAAGDGSASAGRFAGVAPGASVLGLSAGDLFIVNVLEGFDYILDRAANHGVRVVNCSWGTQGWFDPDDPVNVATRLLYDAGIVVVFAAGNHGPAPDTLNPYSVAPWVVGVGSVDKQGRLSDFSSRGIHEELLYHPAIVAPGEAIVGARAGAVPEVGGIAGIADPGGGITLPPPDATHYTVSSGTSFAAPHVAGAVALMFEADPSLTPAQILKMLQQGATPMPLDVRASVGAGRLDAWSAVSLAIDPDRRLGEDLASRLDERAYTIDHQPAVEATLTMPANGTIQLPVSVPAATVSWQLHVAWGTVPGLADVDVRLLDTQGGEFARSESLNGHGLFGRVDGLQLLGDVPPSFAIELFFKNGGGLSQEVSLRHEASTAALPGSPELSGLDDAARADLARAFSLGLITTRNGAYAPDAPLRRGEWARSLAWLSGAPQRVPGTPSFSDTAPSSAAFPYAESVAGRRAEFALIDGDDRFRPLDSVRRIDWVVGAVRLIGQEDAALALAGQPLGLADEASVPSRLRGYFAVALTEGLIETVDDGGTPLAAPSQRISRLEAARSLLAVHRAKLAALDALAPLPACGDGIKSRLRDSSSRPDAGSRSIHCLPSRPSLPPGR